MAKLAKSTVYTTTSPQKETSLEKTTRIVKRMQDGDTKKRHIKMNRRRNDRLESEANASVETAKAKPDKAGKTAPEKTNT
ncbi:MAG: hypothetical protein ACJAZ1_003064 [Yoonia sp.]|jgi:hypothetical protein